MSSSARIAAVLATTCLVCAVPAHARLTHCSIEPLAAGLELESAAYFPLELGRTWTYRDSTGIRYRWVIAGAVSPVDKAGKKHEWLRRREASELPKDGGPPKLLERSLRGQLSNSVRGPIA